METKQHTIIYEDVLRDIAELEERLKKLRAVEEYVREKTCVNDKPRIGRQLVYGNPSTGRFSNGTSHSKAAIAILREAGKPLKTMEIVQQMIANGYHAPDIKKLKSSLFTTMTRQKHTFQKAGRGVWKLTLRE